MSEDRPHRIQDKADQAGTPETLWNLFLTLADRRRKGIRPAAPVGLTLSAAGDLKQLAPEDPEAQLIWSEQGLTPGPHQDPEVQDMISLYAPLFPAEVGHSLVLAHLGQSVDAKIATQSGDSQCVTGHANIVHLHRLRALSDAIIIGAGTAATDNPRLTTRLVTGPNPVRVVIDPERRVSTELQMFNDGVAPSLIACAADRLDKHEHDGRYLGLPRDAGGGLALADLVSRLQQRGLSNLFIEGGGITVSRWLSAGLLDRLHVAIAPLFIGRGRTAIDLPPAPEMTSCLRPQSRVYRLGEDLLWDFDLRAASPHPPPSQGQVSGPFRVR